MKQPNLDFLFVDQIRSFAHLVTPEPKTKTEFLQTVKNTYDIGNPKTSLFYQSCERSDFDSIRLNETRDSILFNQ